MTDDIAYFCGGTQDGKILTIAELTHHLPLDFPIFMYHWTDLAIKNPPDFLQCRVWEFNSEHKHSWAGGGEVDAMNTHEQRWAELDAAYYKFNNDGTLTAQSIEHLKGYMRGLAWSIALDSAPWFSTADEIVQECHNRYLKSFDPESDYCTPGTGRRRLELPEGSKYTRTRQPEAPVQNVRHNLTDEQVEKLKAARASGMFPDSELKEMYGLTDVQLRSL